MPTAEEPVDLAALRAEYADVGLDEADLAPDPEQMFRRWLHDALVAGVHEPNAMVLSTIGLDGRPTSRMVLLKGIDQRGLVLFTNRTSRKAQELAADPRCSLLFPWHALERQVRIEGEAEALDRDAVEAYHRTRPRAAQLGAWASRQSQRVASRAELTALYAEMADRFEGREIPVPDHWGGYRVVPSTVEFWQGRPGRMHDRLAYVREGQHWRVHRLAP